jgi:hypothetical protein
MTTQTASTYLIFAGETYYPAGGWDDLYGRASTFEEALEIMHEALFVGSRPCRTWWGLDSTALQYCPREWAQIVSLETMEKVEDPRIDAIRAENEERIRQRDAEYNAQNEEHDSIVLMELAEEAEEEEEEEEAEEEEV